MKGIALLISILIFSPGALAVKSPAPGKTDPRIKVLTYSPRDVYQINGHYGYTTHIILSPEERIEHVSTGDSLAWHIIPKANNLFLKPIEDNANTNLTILTNLRAYNFLLSASNARGNRDKSLTFAISFRYPGAELKTALERERLAKQAIAQQQRKAAEEIVPNRSIGPEGWNLDYTRKGDAELAPLHVLDDGEFTYFQFAEGMDLPAIFLVDKDQQESLVNFHVKGKYTVVQRIAKQFVLRRGKIRTCIYNDAYSQLATAALPEHNTNKRLQIFAVHDHG